MQGKGKGKNNNAPLEHAYVLRLKIKQVRITGEREREVVAVLFSWKVGRRRLPDLTVVSSIIKSFCAESEEATVWLLLDTLLHE